MMKILSIVLVSWPLFANVAVSGDTYKKRANQSVQVLYAKEYEALSQRVMDFESSLIDTYTKSFGYTLDDTQYLGLLSSHNQVANAYATQIPLNLQMNFVGGALIPDYFSTKSWIEGLLWHESAHNFQMNPKKNPLSRYAHKIVKNSFLTSLLFVPLFPVPNLAESSFILEGNAVLNESWHGNGGRLYSGRFLAMALTQAKAGYITPQRTYNNHLYFPYGTHHYIVGGFFQLFLAEKFGIDKTNSYFYNFSGQWIPIFTNAVFKETFGEDFETLLASYQRWLVQKYSGFKASHGEVLLRSKSYAPMNADEKEIYFLSTDHLRAPRLIRFDKQSQRVREKQADYAFGKVFKYHDKFYTSSSRYTSPEAIMIGLYDEEGVLLKASASKSVQSYKKEKMVYFDVPSSYDTPQLYVDGEYIGGVNSSVYSDDAGALYYFKQENKRRTLYRNQEKLISFEGYYGFVCDVKDDKVYFISNTKNGTGLYAYHDGEVSRVLEGDDILDARLIDAKTALITSIDAQGTAVQKIALSFKPATVESPRYFFEKDPRFGQKAKTQKTTTSTMYRPRENLHYTQLSQSFAINGNEVDFSLNSRFEDPLSQNSVNLFMHKIAKESIAGVGYANSENRLRYGTSVYATIDQDVNISSRGFGANLYLAYPLIKEGYDAMDVRLDYLLPDDKKARSPLTLSLNYTKHKYFGHSMYLNNAHDASIALGLDRGDKALGATYFYKRDFAHQFYANVSLKGAFSDGESHQDKRGLLVTRYHKHFSDALDFEMPSAVHDTYVKNIVNAGLGVQKVFDIDQYFFSFPVSLRREALYGKYHYYMMQFMDDKREDYHELSVGIRADMLYFNSLPLPISVEYIYNEKLKNANNFRVLFDLNL